MKPRGVYCEECLEDIPNAEMYWEEERLYCGRCGSELEIPPEHSDVYERLTGGRVEPVFDMDGEAWLDDSDDEEELKEDKDSA